MLKVMSESHEQKELIVYFTEIPTFECLTDVTTKLISRSTLPRACWPRAKLSTTVKRLHNYLRMN